MLTDTAAMFPLVRGTAYTPDQLACIRTRADFALSDMEALWSVLCDVNAVAGMTDDQRQHAADLAYGLTILAGKQAAPVIPLRSAAE